MLPSKPLRMNPKKITEALQMPLYIPILSQIPLTMRARFADGSGRDLPTALVAPLLPT